MEKLDFIQIKNFCFSKDIAMEQKKIFAKHLGEKGLIYPELQKELPQLNNNEKKIFN